MRFIHLLASWPSPGPAEERRVSEAPAQRALLGVTAPVATVVRGQGGQAEAASDWRKQAGQRCASRDALLASTIQ